MSDTQKKQSIQIGVIVILLGAAVIMMLRPKPEPSVSGAYYYDLSAAELVVRKPGAPMPSGGHVVLAAVYSCSACNDESTHFIGYLSKESDELKRAMQSGDPPTAPQMAAGSLMRTVDGREWIPTSSEAGMALAQSVTGRCPPDKPAVLCQPRQ